MGSEGPQQMRPQGWRGRLIAYLAETRGRAFEYGVHDCTLFACGAVEAITGSDPAADYRGRYGSYEGGLRRLRRNGLMDHVDLFRSLFEMIRPVEMIIGDVAVIRTEDGSPALGVGQGSGLVYVLTVRGMETIEMTDPRITSAFRIE